MKLPETRYAKSGDVHIAYQVVGTGPLDLVFVPGFVSNVEYVWEYPRLAEFYRRLASFSRLVLFDKRGTGVSDRVKQMPTLEQRMDDVRAVMDAVGSERAAVMGVSEGAPMAALFGATYPQRTVALVLYGSLAKGFRTLDHPWFPSADEWPARIERLEQRWGSSEYFDENLRVMAPSAANDEEFRRWWTAYRRLSASPAAAADLARMNSQIDVSHALPTIRVPTLVLHRAEDQDVPAAAGRYVAERIPGAAYVELPGRDHLPFIGDMESVLEAIERFLGVPPGEVEPDRVLATVLFTDIVGSTAKAAALGDRRWGELLKAHHVAVRRELARFRGRELDTVGDGFLAAFDGPARAIRCACTIVQAVRELGLEVRAGLHTGECERLGEKLGGIALHIGARVAAQAGHGEVLVSSTVKDLVAGSGLHFEDRGTYVLKGVPGEWRLYGVLQEPGA